MKRIFRFVLFGLIVFSMIFGGTGTLRVGPFSLRHICTFLLIAYVLNKLREVRLSGVLKFYVVYLLFYIIANIVNGEIYTHHFIQSFYTYHLPSLSILIAFPLLVKTEEDVSLMSKAIIVLYSFNAIITILQYMGVPVAWEIGRSIGDLSDSKSDALDFVNQNSETLFGYAMASGIIGFAVTNGYITASYFPLLSRVFYGRYNMSWIYSSLLVSVALVAVFAIQQRAAFFLILIYILFLVFVRFNAFLKISVLLVLLVFVGFTNYSFDYDLGRLQDISDALDSRQNLMNNFEAFLDSPYMTFGGYETYTQNFGMAQHNTFLSAWVLGGLFGFMCFVLFYLYLIVSIIVVLKRVLPNSKIYTYTLVYGTSSVIYLSYSLTHSDGVQNGSPMFWILFTLFLISYRIELKNNYVETYH